jgi:hypothetical protein
MMSERDRVLFLVIRHGLTACVRLADEPGPSTFRRDDFSVDFLSSFLYDILYILRRFPCFWQDFARGRVSVRDEGCAGMEWILQKGFKRV